MEIYYRGIIQVCVELQVVCMEYPEEYLALRLTGRVTVGSSCVTRSFSTSNYPVIQSLLHSSTELRYSQQTHRVSNESKKKSQDARFRRCLRLIARYQ